MALIILAFALAAGDMVADVPQLEPLRTTGTPVAVEVAGMPPQMDIATSVAARENWRFVCRGHAGEMTVLRFALPTGLTSDSVMKTLGDRDQFVAMSRTYYAGDRIPARCNEQVPRQEGPSLRALGYGPAEALARAVTVARSCGFENAAIRDYRPGDAPGPIPGLRPDWKTLDAGENIMPRYGPMSCYSVLVRRGGASRWK